MSLSRESWDIRTVRAYSNKLAYACRSFLRELNGDWRHLSAREIVDSFTQFDQAYEDIREIIALIEEDITK